MTAQTEPNEAQLKYQQFLEALVTALLAGAELRVNAYIEPGQACVYHPTTGHSWWVDRTPGLQPKPQVLFHSAEERDQFVARMSSVSPLLARLLEKAPRT